MATSAFSKSLGVYAPPAAPAAQKAVTPAQVGSPEMAAGLNLLGNLIPIGLQEYNKSVLTDIKTEVSGELFKIYEAKNQGVVSPAEAHLKYKDTVLQFKKNNPEYIPEIDAVTKSTLGFHPIAQAESAESKGIETALNIARLVFPNNKNADGEPMSPEEMLNEGLALQANLHKFTTASQTRKETQASLAAQQPYRENSVYNTVGSAFFSNMLGSVVTNIDKLAGGSQTEGEDAEVRRIISDFKGAIATQRSTLITFANAEFNKEGSAIINPGESIKRLTERFDNEAKSQIDILDHALKNGYLERITRQSKTIAERTGLEIQQVMPIFSALNSVGGTNLASALFNSLTMGEEGIELLPKINAQFQNMLSNLIVGEDQTQRQGQVQKERANVEHILKITTKEGTTIEDLIADPEAKKNILGVLVNYVNSTKNNTGTQSDIFTTQNKQGMSNQKTAFFNSSFAVLNTADQTNVTRKDSLNVVANMFDSKYTTLLKQYKKENPTKTDQIADKAVEVMYKAFNINAVEAAGSVEFNKTTNSYQPKVSDPMMLDRFSRGKYQQLLENGMTSADAMNEILGFTPEESKRNAAQLNKIAKQIYELKDFTETLGKFKDYGNFADGMNQTLFSYPISYVQGQKGNKNNLTNFLSQPDGEKLQAKRSAYSTLLAVTGQQLQSIQQQQQKTTKKLGAEAARRVLTWSSSQEFESGVGE